MTVRHVLVPMDDCDPSRSALEHVCETYPDARITVVHVAEPYDLGTYTSMTGGPSDELDAGEDMRSEAAAERFETARSLADEWGVTIETEVLAGKPARAILTYVDEHDVDHVVMGSHGRAGVSRVLLGSVAETVLRRAPVPVTIVR